MNAASVGRILASLSGVDVAVIAIYFVAVLALGFVLKRQVRDANDFFLAGREMTAWIAGLSFLAANMGALKLMGWAAGTYEYVLLRP